MRSFVILALAISWTLWSPLLFAKELGRWSWVLYYAGVIGPAAAAFVCARADREPLARRVLRWRVHPLWYGAALLLPLLIRGVALAAANVRPVFRPAEEIAKVTLLMLVAVPFEEIGWRGYALPRLQRRYSALVSSLILACIWALWHLPLAWASVGYQQSERPWAYMARFFVTIIPITCFATWLFNRTGESVPVVSLFHIVINLADFLFVLPSRTGETVLWLGTAILAAIVAVLWWRDGTL